VWLKYVKILIVLTIILGSVITIDAVVNKSKEGTKRFCCFFMCNVIARPIA